MAEKDAEIGDLRQALTTLGAEGGIVVGTVALREKLEKMSEGELREAVLKEIKTALFGWIDPRELHDLLKMQERSSLRELAASIRKTDEAYRFMSKTRTLEERGHEMAALKYRLLTERRPNGE